MSLKNKMTRSGVVVSNKTEKTVVVRVERVFQHALYDRTVQLSILFGILDVFACIKNTIFTFRLFCVCIIIQINRHNV